MRIKVLQFTVQKSESHKGPLFLKCLICLIEQTATRIHCMLKNHKELLKVDSQFVTKNVFNAVLYGESCPLHLWMHVYSHFRELTPECEEWEISHQPETWSHTMVQQAEEREPDLQSRIGKCPRKENK